MRAELLPAARGWSWIAGGFALFRRNPAALTFLVFGYMISLVIVGLVPLLGNALASVVLVPLSMGVMNGCRMIDRGEMPPLTAVFSGFEKNTRALLMLGAIYYASTMAILGIATLIDGGDLAAAIRAGRLPPPEALERDAVLVAALVGAGLAAPLTMAYWFSPMLAAWHGTGAGKALFFSLVALWRNWRALLVFSVAAAALAIAAPGVLLVVASALSIPPPLAAAIVMFPLLFVFFPTMFASVYVSYREVFGQDAGKS